MRADRSTGIEKATSPRPAAALPGAVKGEDMARNMVPAAVTVWVEECPIRFGVVIKDDDGQSIYIPFEYVRASADALLYELEKHNKHMAGGNGEASEG